MSDERVDLRLDVSILGVPVAFESNSAEVLEVARAAYDPPPTPPARARAHVRIVVHRNTEGGEDRVAPIASLPEHHRLVLELSGGQAYADASRGEAEARVAAASVRAPDFREGVLDHLALFLVTAFDRCPFHASGIVLGGRAVLFAGASGLGKSTLTYAAMRAGHRVLADDAVYVARAPAPELWGAPRRIHLTADAVRHFPELSGQATTPRPDGRWKIAVEVAADARATSPWTGPVALCLLSRSARDEPVRSIPADEAAVEMRTTLQGGFRRFADALDDYMPIVTSGGCWRVAVTVEPSVLLRRLQQAVGE